MTCVEARRYLDPFHDNELEMERNLEVLKHLNLCAECASIFDAERAAREAMRERWRAEGAPPGLRARCREAIASRSRGWIAASAAAAASLAVALALLVRARPMSETEFLDAVVARHEAPPGAERLETREAMEAFFAARGARACLHELKGWSFRAGAVVRDLAPGRAVCWTLQEGAGGRLTHVNVAPEAVAGLAVELRIVEHGGRGVVVVRGPGFV